jgi:drug/metabolite transporter, DME family
MEFPFFSFWVRFIPMKNSRGSAFILVACILWSTSGAFSKFIALSGPLMSFWRALFAALVLLPFLKRGKLKFRPLMMGMVLCFATMNVAFISAMTLTTAANVIFLQYTAPLFIALASPLFGERFDSRNRVPLLIGLVGVSILMWGSDLHDLGVWLALLSGVAYAGVALFLRLFRDEDAIFLTFLNHAGSACSVGAVLFLLNFPLVVPSSTLGLLFVFGAVQMALPYLLFAHGLKSVSAQQAGILTLLEPLLNPLVTFFVVGEIPSAQTWLGGVFLLSGLTLQLWQSTLKRNRH